MIIATHLATLFIVCVFCAADSAILKAVFVVLYVLMLCCSVDQEDRLLKRVKELERRCR